MIAVGHWQALAGRATKWLAPELHACFSPDRKDSRVITQHLKAPQNALCLPFLPSCRQARRARLPTTDYKEQKKRVSISKLKPSYDIGAAAQGCFAHQDCAVRILQLQGSRPQSTTLLPATSESSRHFEEITCLLNDWANSKAAFQGFQRTHNQPGETESLA